ncbi:TetR family transcriptional regulator C-terminal domain-containing protein [Sneathia vaginalis]|nr:TetR family transcriptional regulator C-terminal domain-containing protein [Sneathia vaginalis]MDK9581716.1 TetR family transcriptional regulator C-terminal domain-containing protein [Sneathia vaginalis]
MVKLRSFFFKYFSNVLDNDCHGGSLLGNLAIEMSDINNDVRERINDGYGKLEVRLMIFLQMMYNSNPRYKHIKPEIYSKILINQMEGTMLKLKASKDDKEIDTFFQLFDYIMYKNELK